MGNARRSTLDNARLRKLAAALGPAYERVSGTQGEHDLLPRRPHAANPPGLRWGWRRPLAQRVGRGVLDFSKAVDAKLVSSFATGPGTRDAQGNWTPKEAQKILSYTKGEGGSIAAAEFMNEPTAAAMGGAPKGYDAAAFARDLKVFGPFIRKAAPDMIFLGPGSVGEGVPLGNALTAGSMPFLKSEDPAGRCGPVFDAFSYHFYGAVSNRCASIGQGATTTPEAALSPDWLSRTDNAEAFYQALRDRFEPGKPLWGTETADAASRPEIHGLHFPRQLPLSRPVGTAREKRRSGRDPQYAGVERLRIARWQYDDARDRITGPRCYGASSWAMSS